MSGKKPIRGSPRRQSRIKISDPVEELQPPSCMDMDDEVDAKLTSLGYSQITTILADCKWIKATNPLCQKVYIKVDSPCTRGDLKMQHRDSSVLPHSLKVGSLKLANYQTSGIAFEWSDPAHLCFVEYQIGEEDENVSMTECHLSLNDANPLSSHPMSYPLIKYSELLVDSKLVMEGCDTVTRQLRNTAFQNNMEDLKELLESIKQLTEAVEDLIELSTEQGQVFASRMKTDSHSTEIHDDVLNLIQVQKSIYN
jgi:hypothetical protein